MATVISYIDSVGMLVIQLVLKWLIPNLLIGLLELFVFIDRLLLERPQTALELKIV